MPYPGLMHCELSRSTAMQCFRTLVLAQLCTLLCLCVVSPPAAVAAGAVASGSTAARVDAQTTVSPFVFGSGYIYGWWKPAYASNLNKQRAWNAESLQLIASAGGRSTGLSFNWVDIEPQRGVFNWTQADAMVEQTRAAGLTGFAYTGNTPDWALAPSHRGQGLGYRFPPAANETQAFSSFFTALARRYSHLPGRYYEFWNEPNGCSWINNGCANGNMAPSYAPWLCRWYKAMKAGDPNATLSVGGLDYHYGVTNGYQYLEHLYGAGAGDCFDAVALHPYNSGQPGQELNWGALPAMRRVLEANGDGHKGMWVNEYGWKTADETLKSTALTTVLTALTNGSYPYVTNAMYLALTDLPGVPDSGHGYGLCSQDTALGAITPRQSYVAFKNFPKPV